MSAPPGRETTSGPASSATGAAAARSSRSTRGDAAPAGAAEATRTTSAPPPASQASRDRLERFTSDLHDHGEDHGAPAQALVDEPGDVVVEVLLQKARLALLVARRIGQRPLDDIPELVYEPIRLVDERDPPEHD